MLQTFYICKHFPLCMLRSKGGQLVDVTAESEAALQEMLGNLERAFGAKGVDMTQFPKLQFSGRHFIISTFFVLKKKLMQNLCSHTSSWTGDLVGTCDTKPKYCYIYCLNNVLSKKNNEIVEGRVTPKLKKILIVEGEWVNTINYSTWCHLTQQRL